MPIYEFYCPDCHCVFNFFSRNIKPDSGPGCPRCARVELDRLVSRFAVSRGRKESEEDPLAGADEAKMEQLLTQLGPEMEGLDEKNPRQMAGLMRRMFEAMGQPVTGRLEEAVRRLEAGEDPEAMEEEMDGLFAEGDPFLPGGLKSIRRKYLPPSRDEKLYDW